MTVTIGRKPESDFTEPLGMLTDCHRRIERFLGVMITITEQARGASLSQEQRRALETAVRYFHEGAPKHTCDEEESLFPRLRASRSPEARAALDRLEALHADHTVAEAAHHEAETLARRWLDEGGLPAGDAARLAEVLASLRAIYERHIAVEDAELFPLAGRVLDRASAQALGREMAERRGLPSTKRL